MCRRVLLALPALLLLLLAPAALRAETPQKAAPEPAASTPETWYAQAIAVGRAGINVTSFWSKGAKLRAETVVAGHRVINIVNGEWYYAYDALAGRGIAIRRDPAAVALDATRRRPFGDEYDRLIEQGAELIREENVKGAVTGVFRVTDDRGKRELWATLDSRHLPLKLEIYDRRSSEYRQTDWVDWLSGFPASDAFFTPESRIELERLELAEYFQRTLVEGPVGPVPVLYAPLLHVRGED
jgi:hypothetical protein